MSRKSKRNKKPVSPIFRREPGGKVRVEPWGTIPEEAWNELRHHPMPCVLCGALEQYARGVFIPGDDETNARIGAVGNKFRILGYNVCRSCWREHDDGATLTPAGTSTNASTNTSTNTSTTKTRLELRKGKNMEGIMEIEATTPTSTTPTRRKSRPAAPPDAPATHDAAALLLEVEAEHAKLTGAKESAEQRLRALAARGGTRPEREGATATFKAAALAIEAHLPLLESAREEARAAEARAQRAEEARTRAEQDAALAEARGRVDAALERADAALAAFEAAGAGVVETVGELTRELTALFAHPKALPWRAEPRTKRLVQAQARLMKAALAVLVDGLGHKAAEAMGHPDAQRIRAEALQGRRRVLEIRGL